MEDKGQPVEKLPKDLPWQVTTTAIWCPAAQSRVALLVKNDWTAYCTWFRDRSRGHSSNVPSACEGSKCSHVEQYLNNLIQEELGDEA
ncbi:MAG: hypothetical protein V2J25_02635 [Desulfatiglans sp.]|jgi:hypothetical protein|nr:hypothetical protein [Thermodesulfobacteriota bacterium]MEE4351742.1 hypothetical protein [Desulfatiglans sp.]